MSMAYVAIAATVITTAYTGYTQHENNKYMEKQAQADADAVAAQGRVEAERIRKDKEKAQSKARAALAENGLSVNEGTSIVINDQIEQDGAYDANMAEIAGYNGSQRLKGEASVYGKNANTALVGGALNTASAGASAYGARGGWK
ncbi:hypothetical protein P3S51_04070 [Acinetobacter sp. ANC 7201]|uniref:hypothetical protein n=1 Tax=Acinetobacter sp. ANC 7201 TaxID=3035288 RepID=UPI0027A0F62D|nr:hypothetical protein [Acinetobacter sp. ANC 7201]WFP97520.1 hypothetical protein P3S51_04070 [Acinetobacter sp. ANC 7201]